MRSSPAALLRVFLDAPGRTRGRVASPPRLEIPSALYVDPESGVARAIEIRAGGGAALLPQIVFMDAQRGQLGITGSVKQELESFLESLRLTLGDVALLVHKQSASAFAITTFRWQGSEYVEQMTATCPKPPAECIWLEQFAAPVENESVSSRRSLLFRHSRGQLALRLLDTDTAAHCLSLARKAAAESSEAVRDAIGKDVDKPCVTLRMSIDEEAWVRVQLKIGANLAHHVFGSAIGTPDMLTLRKFVRFGGEMTPLNVQQDPAFLAILNALEGEMHLMVLATVPVPDSDRCALVFGLRLFRAAFVQMTLAEDLPRSACGAPRIFCVRYRDNRIEQVSVEDLARNALAAGAV
jgi:hypothetical protein